MLVNTSNRNYYIEPGTLDCGGEESQTLADRVAADELSFSPEVSTVFLSFKPAIIGSASLAGSS